MSIADTIKLTIDEKAYGYAKIYASLLSDEFQRKRAYASILALYAFLNVLEKTPYEIQKAMTLFRNPVINEQYEISDLYVNGWHLDVRVVTGGDAVLVPKIHFDADIVPDFYVVIKVDSELKTAELIGFADKLNLQKEPFDYHYSALAFSSLISYDEFLEKVKNKKTLNLRAEDHELFKESYLGLMDNEIDTSTKNKILKHLFECDECRTEFCCFTGFEMVSCNASKYPELLEDQTLNIIGAQSVDDKKYEGKEETICIKDETEEDHTNDDVSNEETVSDILDELFNVEDFIEDSETVKDKTVKQDDIQSILDNDNEIQIIEDEKNSNELNNDKSVEFEIVDDDLHNEQNNKFNDNDDVQLILEEDNQENSLKSDFEVISENSDYDLKEKEDIVFLENQDDSEMIESIENKNNTQKVIVDYDENDKPVYSYITPVEQDEAENFSSEIETIVDEDDMNEEEDYIDYIDDISTEEIVDEDAISQKKDSEEIYDDFEEYDDIKNKDDLVAQEDDLDYVESDSDFIDNNTNSEKLDIESSEENEKDSQYEQYEEYKDDELQDYDDEQIDSKEEDGLNDENEEEYEDYDDDEESDIPEEKISKGSSKPVLVLLSVVVLLCMIGGGAFFLLKNKNNTETVAAESQTDNNAIEIQNQQIPNDMFEQPVDSVENQLPQNDLNSVNNQEQPDINNPMTDSIPTTGTISVPQLTESDLIKPVDKQSHGDVNKAIANAFSQGVNGVSVRGLNWFCTSELFSDRTFKNYLQNLDNSLKQNLKNNILNATQIPPKDSVSAKFAVDNNGNLQKVIISDSSGLEEIDNIVLQSIKECFEGEKGMILNDSDLKSDMYYLKVVIKL